MRIPFFSPNKTVSVTVPSFDGGVNATDAPSLMADNALAACRNVWFHNGQLRTRAGFWTSEDWRGKEEADATVRYLRDSKGWFVSIALMEVDGEAMLRVTARAPQGGEALQLMAVRVPFGATYVCVPSAGVGGSDALLLYVSDGRIWALQPSLWEAIEVTSRIYVPTVTVNGRPLEGRLGTDSGNVVYQQRNRLTDRVRSCYTPDGVGVYYHLPYQHIRGDVRIWVSGVAGSMWEYHISADASTSAQVNGRWVVLERTAGMFYFKDKEGENTALPVYSSPNSVAVDYHLPFEDPLVFDMTFGEWYGGDKSSVGGHRLFLSGNADMPHAVIWSVAENPFYFPETAYTTVGLSDKAITVFGKQDGSLVIFKENEIYVAEYVRGATAITDTLNPLLPVYAIHTEIGCDCPDTVALMGGQLTWMCRDGNVYRLKAPSSYGNRSVIAVSEQIRARLQGEEATSARVWDGHYYLLCNGYLWVMTDAETPTWYSFAWPENGTQPYGLYGGASLKILAKAGGREVFWFSLEGTQDIYPLSGYERVPVRGMMRTKFYDFGSTAYKRVLRVAVESRATLIPQYVTENGIYRDSVHCPDRGGMVMCTPHLPRCRRWALQLEGEELTVGGMTAVAKTEGGI